MNKHILKGIIGLAFFMIAVGIIFAFVNLQTLHINIKNSGFVGAIFSLSGVLLYFTALMYQIKEYQLQVEELRKTVEAQTKSSVALDEQRKILLEQNTNSLIFGMIDNFNSFKQKINIEELSQGLIGYIQPKFYSLYNELTKEDIDKKDFNIRFARGIKEVFEKMVNKSGEFKALKKYMQFAYNVLYLIDQRSKILGEDIFTAFFFSQIGTNETILLYLSNLSVKGMPIYDNLHWGIYDTKEIVDMIKQYNSISCDYSMLNLEILTEEFNKIKQSR